MMDTTEVEQPEINIGLSENVDKSGINEESIKKMLEVIQSTSVRTKEIYKGLIFIRTKVIDDSEGIKLLLKCDGMSVLLKIFTSNNNDDILNLTLSILGNSSNHLIVNEVFTNQVLKHRISGRIVVLLKRNSKTAVQRRLCRLIGNLAQSHLIAKDLHSAGVTYAVVLVLNNSDDIEVQHMAIRALRWLWRVDKHHIDMLKAGVVKSVSKYLSSKDEEVIKATLRTLVKFTHQCNIFTAEQISEYKEIVNMLEKTSVVAVLICNLSYDPRARIELCKAGAVEAIVNRLHGGNINSYLITGLCQMCRESMVRASLRLTHNGFKTLLSLLSNKNSKHFYPEILDAITQFNYDQVSLMKMVQCGLIGVLIEKLSEYTKVHCLGHTEAISVESMGPMSPASPSSWSGSPSPPPQSPPRSGTTDITMDDINYSPRCTTPDTDSSSDSPVPTISMDKTPGQGWSSPVGLDGCILDVLSHLTYQDRPMRALATKATITTFLAYLVGLPYPRYRSNYIKATRAFTAIVMCKHYWNTLLDDESVLDIHRQLCRSVHEDCWQCKRIQVTGREVLRDIGLTAQSGLGEGEITYRLMGVSSDVRLTAALTIPHVIRQPNLLQTLLYKHNALKELLGALSTRIDEVVASLHSLFTTLAVDNPQQPIQMCSSCAVGQIRQEGTVLFRLDDGSTVSANKESLSHSCPVFEAMFRGGFKESIQSTVHLSDISSDCLAHLTRVLHEYCSCALPKDLPVLLEMISVSDRFLLPELTGKVAGVVRDWALTHSTAAHIYDWGLTIGEQYTVSANLSTDVVKYLFSAEMLLSQRTSAVAHIFNSDNKESFLQHLSHLVESALVNYTKTHRFYNYKK